MLNETPTPTDESRPRFDAFISYRAQTSSKAAHQLQRALVALSKRHRPDGDLISLFLDTQSLIAGKLSGEIKNALKNSRCLIVLLGPDTYKSPWVDLEIRHWLDNGGDVSRLFLVRHDPSVDLKWDDARNDFAEPRFLPSALAKRFPEEQKWVELQSSLTGTDETALVGLYAPIAGIRPEDLLLAEANFQQRRQRQTRAIVSALSILLVMALVAATMAFSNWRSSESNRARADREAVQARAEANAAQALLAAGDSAARGIRLGVEAAQLSSSTSVRAALLAVADSSAVLQHAFEFPRADAGYPGTGVAFSHDGSHLFAWGHAPDDDDSYLVQWDLETGRQLFATRLRVPNLSGIASVGSRWAAGCSDAGPLIISLATREARRLDPTWSHSWSCTLHTFAGGLLVTTQEKGGSQGISYFANHGGETTELAGMPSVAVRPEDPAAVVAGAGGIAVVRADGVHRLGDQPVRTVDVLDNSGGFAVRADDRRWLLGRPDQDGYQLTEVRASPEAVDSAPRLTLSGLTGELAEVAADGTVSMPGTPGSVRIESRAREERFFHSTRIRPVEHGFVVVFRDGASVVWPPGEVSYPPLVKDMPRDTWRALPSGWSQSAGRAGEDAVLGACANGEQVYLTGGTQSTAVWAVDANRLARRFNGFATSGLACGVVSVDEGLRFSAHGDGAAGNTVLRKSSAYDGLALSTDESKIAVVQAELPIEVLSSKGASNQPWGMRQMPLPETTTALGALRVIKGYDHVRIVRPDGKVQNWRDEKAGTVLAVHPAGKEILADFLGPGTRAILITETGKIGDADNFCAVRPAKYVPAPGFQTSKKSARQALLVAAGPRGTIDCHSGKLVDAIPPDRVVDYGIDDDRGRILWRDEAGRLQITGWDGDSSDVRTTPAPVEVSRPGARVSVSDSLIAGIAEGEGLLRIYRSASGGWQQQTTIPVTVQRIVGLALADHGTLAVVVAEDSTFEIFDIATGRRLMASRQSIDTTMHPQRIALYESDGFITILLYRKDELTSQRAVEIPITVPLLIDQLCTAYSAPACSGAGG
ncbi:TIR domain-containing protein [Nocardia sputi]|uniref:TIR domain-containing protein n=1 Tax=Nocardia sputi TaxID=2943705 RepID=UPI0020BD9BFE|nr:TIR domain-containing protein [Nocardia sputi]